MPMSRILRTARLCGGTALASVAAVGAAQHLHGRRLGLVSGEQWPNMSALKSSSPVQCSQLKAETGAQQVPLDACSKGKKVAIYGGSFDPITNAHLLQAAEVIHAQLADEVWIVPCGVRPDKPSLKTPYMHRLNMCHQAVNTTFGSRFPMLVSDFEMDQNMAYKTLDLMKALEARYPEKEFFFAMGSDLYESMKSWESGDPQRRNALHKEIKYIVFDRPGYELKEEPPANYKMATPIPGTIFVSQELSSSEVRQRYTHIAYGDHEREKLQKGLAWMIDGLIPPAVMGHIIRYKLYEK